MPIRWLIVAVPLAWSPAALAQDAGREHSIPLFMAGDDPDGRQGFIRVINHSNHSGTVRIYGIDDTGERKGPIELSIDALATAHFNSDDVEDGAETKGLPEGLGDGEGNWRLLLYGGDLDIEPLVYVRTEDGFLTSMHDVVQEAAIGHRVPIFNPAINVNQKSWLRLINPGETKANVTIQGLDDKGAESQGQVDLVVPAGGARKVTAQDLEMGAVDLDGNLGDGAGKWSLFVTSDEPVQVMSLMGTPTGHLTNLSATKRDYVGPTGLWRVSFDDEEGGEGYVILLPDSRMYAYAWLPESADTVRIARATYDSSPGTLSGSGELFESGKVEQVGFSVLGGSEAFEFTADYRAGDWLRGEYTETGEEARAFRGWALSGFQRGGSNQEVVGLWSPELGDEADLPGEFEPDGDGDFEFTFTVNGIRCTVEGTLRPVNSVFNVFEAAPMIQCSALVFLRGSVELILAVMDAPDLPGDGNRAVVLAVVPDERKLGLGALFDLTRQTAF